MQLQGLEDSLAKLTEIGTPVKLRPYRQVWRFTHAGQELYLKFFPRRGQGLKRLVTGQPALREFSNLQRLQKLGLPAPRAVAMLSGLVVGSEKGDAVLTRSLDPAETLDHYLYGLVAQGRRLPGPAHRKLCAEVIDLVGKLALTRLGHADLHLGNLLQTPPPSLPSPETPSEPGRLYLLDAYALRTPPNGGMRLRDLQTLAFAVAPVATRTDLLRAWKKLAPRGAKLPGVATPVAKRHWRKTVERAITNSPYCGRADVDGWSVRYFKESKFPPPWTKAGRLKVTLDDWQRVWPDLARQLDTATLYPLKRGRSADVWKTEVVLAGVPTAVVVKRPYRRYWYRYATELPRGTRAYRAWWKTWALLGRAIPAAWPLLLAERRVAGVVVDQAFVCEHIAGEQLDQLDLAALPPADRTTLFHRVGRLLRRIDDTGIVHFDTKASNFMVMSHQGRPFPVLVDVDGVRSYSWRGEGLRRLIESLRDHQRQLSPQNVADLRLGYDPFARTPPQ